MTLRLASAAGAAGLLAGCVTLDPAYVRPASLVPAAFPAAGEGQAAARGIAGVQLGWPDFFVDTHLRAVVRLALEQNRDLRVAALNIVEARARYRIERAGLLPTVEAGASLTAQKVSNQGVAGGGAGSGYSRIYSVDAGFSGYELDLFGRVRSLSRAAYESYLATAEARRTTQLSLVAEVATDYLVLAADTQRLRVEQETLAADEGSLKLAEDRFTFGVASALDVRQAQIAVETSRAALATYTTQAAQDRDALDLLVGAPVPADLLPSGQGEALLTQPDAPSGLSSAILLQRPDVVEAEHALKADNADIGAARAAFFPSISLTAQGGSTSLSLASLFGAGTGGYSFSPSVSLPIFDGGANRANLKLSRATRDAAVATYEKAIQTAFRDVADALAQRRSLGALLGAETRLVQAADATLQLSQARYARGSDTYLNVLTAELNLAAARQSLISARLTRATNVVALYRALGGGADTPA